MIEIAKTLPIIVPYKCYLSRVAEIRPEGLLFMPSTSETYVDLAISTGISNSYKKLLIEISVPRINQ